MKRSSKKLLALLLAGACMFAQTSALAEEDVATEEAVAEEATVEEIDGEAEEATVKEVVAIVNGTEYASLQDAFDNAGGATVRLQKDVMLTEPVIVRGDAVLDFNGFTISNEEKIFDEAGESLALISVQGGRLTIRGEGEIKPMDGDCYCVDVRDGGSLTIEDGTFKGNKKAVFNKKGSVTVNGGEFSLNDQNDPTDVMIDCDDDAELAGEASVMINDGTFDGWDGIGNTGVSYLPVGTHMALGPDGIYLLGAHDYVLSDDSMPAGCEEGGYNLYVCTICGDEMLEDVPATGNSYLEDEDGNMICAYCGDVIEAEADADSEGVGGDIAEPAEEADAADEEAGGDAEIAEDADEDDPDDEFEQDEESSVSVEDIDVRPFSTEGEEDEPEEEESDDTASEAQYAVKMQKGYKDGNLTDDLMDAGYATADDVKNIIAGIISELDPNAGEPAFYDAQLSRQNDDGEWEDADPSEYPDGDIRLTIAYPEGTGIDDNFIIVHMFDTDGDGYEAGQYELPAVEKTDDGLSFSIMGFSPIAISATSADDDQEVAGEAEPEEGESEEAQESGIAALADTEAQKTDIADAEVAGIEESYELSDSAITPVPVVTINGTELAEGADYELSYEGNDKAGTAKITITGIGDYEGSIEIEFAITEPATEETTEKQTEATEKQTEHVHTVVSDPAVEPTCEEAGLTAGTHCSVCGEVIEAQKEIPATGHTEVVTNGYNATCTTSGLSDGAYCSVCGKILTEQKEIAALGHDFEWITDVEPTEDTRGSRHQECTRCGETGETEEILSLAEQRALEEEEAKNADTVQTGDSTPVQTVLIVMIIALCVLIIVMLIRRRRKG